jgi:hypothetical protein
MNFQAMHKQRKFILILAAIGAISVFLPWFTISAEGLGVRMSESTNGFHGTGVLVFLAFIGAGILALVGDQNRVMEKTMWTATLCAGVIALLFVVINLVRTPNSGDTFGLAQAGPGFGIWISLLASVGTLAAAWALKNPGDTLKGGFDSLKHDLAGLSGPGAPAGPAGPAGPAKPENKTRVDELEKLIELKNQGKISDEEYQRMKSKLF